jgi:hypothetical protein
VGDDVLELPAVGTKSECPFQSSDHCPERVGGMRSRYSAVGMGSMNRPNDANSHSKGAI